MTMLLSPCCSLHAAHSINSISNSNVKLAKDLFELVNFLSCPSRSIYSPKSVLGHLCYLEIIKISNRQIRKCAKRLWNSWYMG